MENIAILNDIPVHKDREAALGEIHARPHLSLNNPATVFHFAFLCSQELSMDLVAKLAGEPASPKLRYASGSVGEFTVKLERHTEFVSCTFKSDMDQSQDSALATLQSILDGNPIEMLVAMQVIISKNTKKMLKQTAFGERTYGGTISGENNVRSTLKPTDQGFIVLSVAAPDQTPNELGRRIQRLIEFETYRTLCLIGLPCARRTSATISEMDSVLSKISSQVEASATASEEEVSKMFNQLVDLSARADALRTETKFRFSASRAYHALVEERIATMNETKSGDIQRLTSFVRSRLNPAIATIDSVVQRQQLLSEDLARALTLLRTRIDLRMSKSNQESLQSMNLRHRQQLMISQTVEGLSIIAITYYAVGLCTYAFKALKTAQLLPVSVEVATGLAIPVVFVLAFTSLRRVRKHWGNKSANTQK